MMKNNIKNSGIIITVILFIGLFNSCTDDFFDTDVGGQVKPEDHFKSVEDAEASYNACFVFLQDIAENLILLNDLRSDIMDVTQYADKDAVLINQHEISSSNSYVNPESFYQIIINVNQVLPYLPGIMEIDRDFDSTTFLQYTTDLITLRSWAYFTLAKLNGEVGLVDEDIANMDPTKAPVYLSKSEIIDVLIEELLPLYDEDDLSRATIDQYVLLGELYLEKGDYDKAIEWLTYGVSGPARNRDYMVTDAYKNDAWKMLFVGSSSAAMDIFTTVPFSFEENQENLLQYWTNFSYIIKPSSVIVDAFTNETTQSNKKGDTYRGIHVSYDTTSTGEPFIIKYSLQAGALFSSDVILYRAADITLLLAEALNRAGRGTDALALLNKGFGDMSGSQRPDEFKRWSANIGVRGRVYLRDKSNPGTMEGIEDLILEERAKELAFEGKRWFDLVRIAERRNNPAYLADKVAAKFSDPDIAEAVRSKLMDPDNWYIPLEK